MRLTELPVVGLRRVDSIVFEGGGDRYDLNSRRQYRQWQHLWLLALLMIAYVLSFLLARDLLSRNSRILLTLPRIRGLWDMRDTVAAINQDVATYPQNRHPDVSGRYIHFANQHFNSGVNNLIQELLLLAELARQADRALVIRPFLLDRYAAMPPQVFLSGPAVGGEGVERRAISLEAWDQVCPPSRTTWYTSAQINRMLGLQGGNLTEGGDIMDKWMRWLKELDEPCVQITHGLPLVFDFDMITTPRVISLFPIMSISPITTFFEWSPIVSRGLAKVLPLIAPAASSSDPLEPLKGLAALHIRRGDFRAHCTFLERLKLGYNSWNLLPSLPDKFETPSSAQDVRTARYQSHCWPDIPRIVSLVRQYAQDHSGKIDRLYIMTNAEHDWLHRLVRALHDDDWPNVTTSLDVVHLLEKEETVVDQAIDMEIGRRAELFIGNGFSSLSSNVVLLRLALVHKPESIRFW